MARAAIFDIDGTLVARGAAPGAATVAAVTACRDHGIACFVATARRPASARVVLGPLAWLADSGVFHSGALARCGASGFAADVAIPAATVATVVALCAAADPAARIGLHAADGGAAFAPDLPARARSEWGIVEAELRPFANACRESACKIAIWREDDGRLHALAESLRARFAGELTAQLLDDGRFLNVVAAGVDKAVMAARLLSAHGLSLADAIAFGDDLSDLGLLRAAGTAVAITGGHPSVIAAAHELAEPPERDGVAAVLARLLIRVSTAPPGSPSGRERP